MAFTYVVREQGVEGNKRYQILECTFTAVTVGYLPTGFSNILYASHNNETTAAAGLVKPNKASNGSTVEFGGIYFSGFTSGDFAVVKIEGR